jgi:ABC-type lipoprotein release transport system permease subunit
MTPARTRSPADVLPLRSVDFLVLLMLARGERHGYGIMLLRAMFVEVSATDPVTLLSVTLLLVVVAMAASWLPARWASAVDPLGSMK